MRSELRKIFNFTEKEVEIFNQQFTYLSLEAGEKLNKIGEDIPGVFFYRRRKNEIAWDR